MFQLTVDRQVQDASVLVHWCLTPQTKEVLKQHARGEPKLLIVVSAGSERSERRTLVPLGNITQRIVVYHPGPNTIFSAIVWPRNDGVELKEEYLRRYSRGYYTDVVTYSGQGQPRLVDRLLPEGPLRGIPGPSIEISVPEEVFAKEPPRWEQKWVEWLLKGQTPDQCVYRRKRLFAYTIQPIIALVWGCIMGAYSLILGITSIPFLAAGFYNLNLKEALLRRRLSDLWDLGEITTKYNFWCHIWQGLSPIPQEEADRREMRRQEKARIHRQQRDAAQRAALARLYEALTCYPDVSPLRPPIRQVVVLGFQGLKAMVCRPFAG